MTNSNLDAEIARRIAAKSKCAVPLPPTKEELQVQLRDVLLAWKAYHDCGEDDDGPLGAPLWERAIAAEDKIRDLKSDEPEVGIAKLITSMTCIIHAAIGSRVDEAMAADAALAGLRWFGLEDLYYEAFPVDAANIKKALLKAEAAS
jgi:hypothetical protein